MGDVFSVKSAYTITRTMKQQGKRHQRSRRLPVIGWCEWVVLSDLNIDRIKCKVDTGARTSVLHAYFIEPFVHDDQQWVRFGVNPVQHDSHHQRICEAPLIGRRWVANSVGDRQHRYAISTHVVLDNLRFVIDLTLTNRRLMHFRMLLGRTAVRQRFVIDPARSCLATMSA